MDRVEHLDVFYHKRKVGTLNRLAIVGDSGMGALSYRPAIPLHEDV